MKTRNGFTNTQSGMKLSLVITLLNESENIEPLLDSVRHALQGFDYEVILVDDGSTDNTVAHVRMYADQRTRLFVLQRNYGQSTAMAAGIRAATGEYVVTLDGDLQNDPADIPRMLALAEQEGFELVAGVRHKRKDGLLLRKIPSLLANALIRKLTGVYLHDYGCSLRLFRQSIAQDLGLYGELHRFIPVLAKMRGAYMTEVSVQHHARRHGKSKYGLGRTFRVMSDLVFMVFLQRYFSRPMHLFGPVGIIATLTGIAMGLYLVFVRFVAGQDIGGRPLLTVSVVLFLAGLQFLTFGFLSEIMMRTYYESQQKPPYHVREIRIGKEMAGFG
jgi:glycosyltransferase involved in cell wall biosynthesis